MHFYVGTRQAWQNGFNRVAEDVRDMYMIFHFFLTGLFWGKHRGRLISEWSSFQAMIVSLVICWLFTAGAVFLLFTSPLTFLGLGLTVFAGVVGYVIGYRSHG